MDAVAPALIGVGLWLAYEAFKNPTPAPISKAIAALKGAPTPANPVASGPGSSIATGGPLGSTILGGGTVLGG